MVHSGRRCMVPIDPGIEPLDDTISQNQMIFGTDRRPFNRSKSDATSDSSLIRLGSAPASKQCGMAAAAIAAEGLARCTTETPRGQRFRIYH